jgi:hypothetical protein
VQLRQECKTIRHISIVLMIVLLIVFLAAPASAIAAGSNSGTGATSSVAAGGSGEKSISTAAVGAVKKVKVVKLAPCATKCTAYVKYTDYTNTITKTKAAYSFKMNGVTYKLYIVSAQTTTAGHSRRTCTPMTRCSVNKLCEQGGNIPYAQVTGSWKKVGPWEITGYYVA